MSRTAVASKLILKYESFVEHPYVPMGSDTSGVTLDPGVDLGQINTDSLYKFYDGVIIPENLRRLARGIGLKGASARVFVSGSPIYTIRIPKADSTRAFEERVLPIYQAKADRFFVGIDKYPDCVQGALDSLIYNRGDKHEDPKIPFDGREEMDALVRLIAAGADFKTIADQLDAMAYLWQDTGQDGLIARRHEEAETIRLCGSGHL